MYQHRQNQKRREESEREELLSRRFTHNSADADTVIFIDHSIQHQTALTVGILAYFCFEMCMAFTCEYCIMFCLLSRMQIEVLMICLCLVLEFWKACETKETP